MFYILDEDRDSRYTVENLYRVESAVYWDKQGGITLYALGTASNVSLLKCDRYIEDTDPSTGCLYIITSVIHNPGDNVITVHGKTFDFLMHRRVYMPDPSVEEVVLGPAMDNLKWLCNDQCNGLGVIAHTSGTDTEEGQSSYAEKPVDEITYEVMKAYGFGRYLRYDSSSKSGNIVFSFGNNKTNSPEVPVFCVENGTATEVQISDDVSNFCNVCRAKAVYTDGTIQRMWYGATESSGKNRRETSISDIKQYKDEENDKFVNRVYEEMRTALAKKSRVTTFSANIAVTGFGTLYNIGDIVRCQGGISQRITGFKKTCAAGDELVSLIIGDPPKNVIDLLKER